MICVEAGAGSRPSCSQARRSTSGSVTEYVPTAPESLPTRIPSSARDSRCRARSSSKAQTASLSPKVVGSACTPCVRPIVSVFRCSSARATTASRARSVPERISSPASRICKRERGVDDVGGRRARSGTSAPRAEPLRDGVDERGQVVLGLLLELGDAGRGGRAGGGADLARRVGRDDPDLGPRIERCQLDLEPALELALLRPDSGHGRAGVAGDHRSDSRYGSGRPVSSRAFGSRVWADRAGGTLHPWTLGSSS